MYRPGFYNHGPEVAEASPNAQPMQYLKMRGGPNPAPVALDSHDARLRLCGALAITAKPL